MRADGGLTVVRAVFQVGVDERGLPLFEEAIWVGRDVLGTETTAMVQPIARVNPVHPWCLPGPGGLAFPECGLGSRPAISADGTVVAFVGNRGDGGGVYLSVRTAQGYSQPELITGATKADLENSLTGESIRLTGFPDDLPIGVTHNEDEVVVLTFFATPTGAGDRFGPEGGLWSVVVDLIQHGDSLVDPRTPEPVVQLGDAFLGNPIERIGIHDPIAEGLDGNTDDHHIVYWVEAAGEQGIIRATWLGVEPSGAAQAVPAQQSSNRAIPSAPLAATAQPVAPVPELRVAQITPPEVVFPAFVVSHLTPVTGEDVTFTNRTRNGAGTPVAATVDFGDGTNPRLLAANTALTHAYDSGGITLASITATDASGSRSTTIALNIDRINAPPVSDPGGPYAAVVDAGVTLDGSASADPDLDDAIVEYAWDLDDDGVFGDRLGATPSLSAADVSNLVCGGACVGGVANPIALRVTDRFDAEATAATTLTLTHAPSADPGGPYEVLAGDGLTLDGRASSDPETPAT